MSRKIEKNKFDKTGENLERGLRAQDKFEKILKREGFSVKHATSEEDMNEHWDLKALKEGKEFRIEVKAMKKISRQDKEPQDKWHWIELHGVRKNDEGWLYGGKADFIAFETKSSFLLVKRKDLVDLVDKTVNKNEFVDSPYKAKYKVYQRKNRPDKLTLIETSKLRGIAVKEYEK